MSQFKACLLCGSENVFALPGYERHQLVKCPSCEFIFCRPIPSIDELKTHYESYPRANSISEITIKRYNELLDSFEKYRKTNNMLDVGCGDGYFLEEAAKRGWRVFGTEFTDEAIAVCTKKTIHMTKGAIQAESYESGFFDVVTSFEVIEHINNPVEETRIYKTILRSGGLLYITTPNFNSISRLMLGPRWNVIEYPEHLCYYTRSTLKRLLMQVGFEPKEAHTTGVSISRFRRSTNGDASIGNRADEAMREKAENNMVYLLLKRSINFLLDLSGKGDSLKATFVKP
jgi:2-polyprenyl-3-methyl-5-hydroxy-6-metoxy-1,4-benzoquinol methylase